MTIRRCKGSILATVLGAAAMAMSTAWSHTLSESLSAWQIDGPTVRVQFTVPDLEARRLSESGKDIPGNERLGSYLAGHLGASSDTPICPRVASPRLLAATAGYSRFEFVFTCPTSKDISIHSGAFYDLVRSHTDFARIQVDGTRFFEAVLTQDHSDIDISGGDQGAMLGDAGFLTYVRMGLMHIFTGIDHISFMLGLVLISRRVRDLLFVVTGFTLGHSLTLALAVTGILRPQAQYIDALVALTIALIGAENIGDASHRPLPLALGLGGILAAFAVAKYLGLAVALPGTLLVGAAIFSMSYLMLTGRMHDAGRVRLMVTLVFGLIHGFGFASNLLEMRLPSNRLAELLVGFNVGVEVGQVTVVLTALLAARLFVRARLAIPRPIFTDIAAAFLIGEGLCWFLQRSVLPT